MKKRNRWTKQTNWFREETESPCINLTTGKVIIPDENPRAIPQFSSYKEYLESDHWKNLRKEKLKGNKYCSICGKTDSLQVHHLMYEKNWLDTKIYQLCVLCSVCHDLVHEMIRRNELNYIDRKISTKFKIMRKKVLRRLREINNESSKLDFCSID